jgi:hypothetical protein
LTIAPGGGERITSEKAYRNSAAIERYLHAEYAQFRAALAEVRTAK